jgi:type IV pilus assembly protein PilV
MRQPRLPNDRTAQAREQRGFTLIEAMVALIVLSVGLLGIAAMYVETLRANRTSLFRTQAVNFASDVADRMRANRPTDAAGVAAGLYNCNGDCEAGDGRGLIAQDEIEAWVNDIADRLPGGSARIEYAIPGANTPAAYDVTISWTEVGQDDPVAYQLRVEI